MATTEPLTKARLMQDSDAPLAGTGISNLGSDLASFTLPRFASATARDTAYNAWVAAGRTMVDGLRCVVAGYEMVRLGGAWRYAGGVVTVPNRAARDTLPNPYDGLLVHQVDTGLTLRRAGGAWRPSSAQGFYNNGMLAGRGNIGLNWGSTNYLWDSNLGDKITVPADGVRRDMSIIGTCGASGQGELRLMVNIQGDQILPFPTVNGVGFDNVGLVGLSVQGYYLHTGASEATIYFEARSITSGSASFVNAALQAIAY